MKKTRVPFNLYILDTSSARTRNLRTVTALDIYVGGGGRELHPEGLFSTEIFGRVGDPLRDKTFAKIDFRLPAFDPTTFDLMMSLKGLYKDIVYGQKFAIFDEAIKDFVVSDATAGDTGYAFFMKHWKRIEFPRTGSDKRDQKILQVEKYKDRAEITALAVLPAGMRDIEVNDVGRTEEDEINELYRRVLSTARVIQQTSDTDVRALDRPRASLQTAIQAVWQYVYDIVNGKRGYAQGRFAGRRIFNGTRNVISAMETTPARLGDPTNIKLTDTQVGIFQTAKGMLPVTIGNLRRYLLKHVFDESPDSTRVKVIDPKTMELVQKDVPFATKDYWVTRDGLTRVIESYRDDNFRFKPLMLEGGYMGLIYEGPDMTFKLFHDINELPLERDRAHVRPINLTDLLYLTNYRDWMDRYTFPTRYPATGTGSIYPSSLRLTATIPEEQRRELNDDWLVDSDSLIIGSYPVRQKSSFYDTMSVHPSKLVGLDGDHDGDMMSSNYLYSDESKQELKRLLDSASHYIDPRGGLRSSPSVYTVELVAHNLTGD